MLALWVVACAAAAVGFRRYPFQLVCAALILWFAVPALADSFITGQVSGSLALHPSSWLMLATFAIQIVQNTKGVLDELGRRFLTYLGLALFLLVALLTSRTNPTGGGTVLIIDQMLVPILMFMLCCIAFAERPGRARSLRNLIIGLAAAESVLALVQWITDSVLIYQPYYEKQDWWDPANSSRWMGTLEHPLTLSLVLCAAIPLLTGLRSGLLQIGLLLLMAAAVFVTQSRTGLIGVGLGVIYVLIRGRMSIPVKTFAVLVVLLGAAFAYTSPLTTGTFDRIGYDNGSTKARGIAITVFLDDVRQYLLIGNGVGTSYKVAKAARLPSASFESAFIMYAIDVGLGFALIYFGIQIVIMARSLLRPAIGGVTLAAAAVIIVPQTYNSLGKESIAGIILWLVLAMATVRRPDVTDDARAACDSDGSLDMPTASGADQRGTQPRALPRR